MPWLPAVDQADSTASAKASIEGNSQSGWTGTGGAGTAPQPGRFGPRAGGGVGAGQQLPSARM